MNVCAFCCLELEKCIYIANLKLTDNGKEVDAHQFFDLFRAEVLRFDLQELGAACICDVCCIKMQSSFSFVKQIGKNYEKRIEGKEVPGSNQLRFILPKNEMETAELSDNIDDRALKKSGRLYRCSACSVTCKSYRKLKIHEDLHMFDSEGLNICEYCNTLCGNEEALGQHKVELHADGYCFCVECALKYKTKGFLLQHMLRAHKRTSLIYHCGICVQAPQFHTSSSLKLHYEEVHLPGPVSTDDIEMNEEFLDEFLLGDTAENSFHFSECWETLDLPLHEILHLHNNNAQETASHENAAAFKCPKCYEELADQKSLLRHLAHKHAYKVLNCCKCEAKFQDYDQLTRHKEKHNSEDEIQKNSFQCDVCDKKLKSSYALNYHIKIHSRTEIGSHECPFCGKSFHTDVNLKQHLRIVHSHRKKHTCQLCDRQFATLDHLKKHVQWHQNDRKHVCDVCHKRFTQLCHLKQHSAIHSIGKRFECNVCRTKFWKKIDLERHIIGSHDTNSIQN